MIYEVEVMMDDRGRFVRRLRELEAEGTVEVPDSGESATMVYAELETRLGARQLREVLEAEDYNDEVAIHARCAAGRQ